MTSLSVICQGCRTFAECEKLGLPQETIIELMIQYRIFQHDKILFRYKSEPLIHQYELSFEQIYAHISHLYGKCGIGKL